MYVSNKSRAAIRQPAPSPRAVTGFHVAARQVRRGPLLALLCIPLVAIAATTAGAQTPPSFDPTSVIQMAHSTRSIREFGIHDTKIAVEIGAGIRTSDSDRAVNYTVGGTAVLGSDYTIKGCTSSPCTMTLAANTRNGLITFNVIDDSIDEDDETIVFTLQSGSGYTVNDTRKTTTVTIPDDETRGLVLRRSWPDLDEGASDIYIVKLASQPVGTVTVNIASDNPDVTVSPTSLTFNASGNSIRWSSPQTVTVSAAEDSDGADDSATLTHTTAGGDYGGANALSIKRSVSVDDNDIAFITVDDGDHGRVSDDDNPAQPTQPAADDETATTLNGCVSAQLHAYIEIYAGETWHNSPDHVERWRRVLAAFGDSNGYSPMTWTEAQTYASRGWTRWVPVVTALQCLEGPPAPGTPVVSIASGDAITEGGTAQFTLTATPAPTGSITVVVNVKHINIRPASDQKRTRTVTIGTGGTGTFSVVTMDDSNDWPHGTVYASVQGGTGYRAAPAPDDDAWVSVANNDYPANYPTLSVSDATVRESYRNPNCARGALPCMTFTVTLSRALEAGERVHFAYRTQESTPVSARGSSRRRPWDFAHAEGTAKFLPGGELTQQIRVWVLDDSYNEGPETFELEVFYAEGARIIDGMGVGTITNTDPLPQAWLGRLGRTVAQQAVSGITNRLSAAREAGLSGVLAGRSFNGRHRTVDRAPAGNATTAAGPIPHRATLLAEVEPHSQPDTFATVPHLLGRRGPDTATQTITPLNLLTGSAFSWTGKTDTAGGSFALWGQGAQARFDGRDEQVTLNGTLTTGLLGADYAQGDWLVGLALSQSQGKGDYQAATAGNGKLTSSLTAVLPYAAWQAASRLSLWGAAGYGTGHLTLRTPGPETRGPADSAAPP